MYENGKMRPTETILEIISGRDNKEGMSSTMIYLRTFENVTLYLQYNNNKKEIKFF
jgi:hypothetical protein